MYKHCWNAQWAYSPSFSRRFQERNCFGIAQYYSGVWFQPSSVSVIVQFRNGKSVAITLSKQVPGTQASQSVTITLELTCSCQGQVIRSAIQLSHLRLVSVYVHICCLSIRQCQSPISKSRYLNSTLSSLCTSSRSLFYNKVNNSVNTRKM